MTQRASINRLFTPRLVVIVVLTFALRALVPLGFMPSGSPFAVELCPDSFPTELLNASTHGHAEHRQMQMPAGANGHDHSGRSQMPNGHHKATDHCPFGSAPATTAAADVTAAVTTLASASSGAIPGDSFILPSLRDYRPPPRGPPLSPNV